jgi:hypothetical protein
MTPYDLTKGRIVFRYKETGGGPGQWQSSPPPKERS